MFKNAYKNKTVMITGHTGFKGSWLSLWLTSLGANVVGMSIDVPTSPSNYVASKVGNFVQDFRADIRNEIEVQKIIDQVQPDYIFHLAAQALVRNSYEQPLDTFGINALGSANVLNAARKLSKKIVIVMITSDKAYDNLEWVWGYRETDRLGGRDPYSASKGMAELVIRSFVESYFSDSSSNVSVGITRAGNVIGGGDWALDRIVPDCMKAWSKNEIVQIRSPMATRPWQHVLEPLSGYLVLGQMLSENKNLNGQPYNFGPPAHQNHPVSELIDEMAKHWKRVKWADISSITQKHSEASLLKLNCDKALFDLKWMPTLQFEETVAMTVEWYKAFYEAKDICMNKLSLLQIEQYSKIASQRGMLWAM